jgi:3',5'-cyclic AMP phosphodiesterase CpdA
MAVITWLHLSDLHFKSGKESEQFNREIVLEALWRDVGNQVTKGLKPDFITMTGDVAYHGKEGEYQSAIERFFDPLRQVTDVPKGRLFVVPGNHDVDWDAIDPFDAAGMRECLRGRDQTNEFLGTKHDRSQAFRRFGAYAGFIKAYLGNDMTFSDTEYFYSRIITVQGHKLGILGLNSAWMSACMRNDQGKALDQGNLLVGERQLKEALAGMQEADLRIALLHHPVDWLHETDRFDIQNRLNVECNLVLHGHWHIPQVNVLDSIAGQAVYIPAGAIYASRDYPNGYSFVQIDPDTGQGRVYFRRYNDKGPKGPEWTKDILLTGEDRDGVVEFSTRQKLPSATSASSRPTARRILLVEDNLGWQSAIRSILVPPGFDLQVAGSYADASEKIQTHFDLIIVNLCLVDDSDYEGVALLEDIGDRSPCIVLTGSGTPTRGLFERYNVCEVFVKGRAFNRAEFLSTVKMATQSLVHREVRYPNRL